jgi:quercetin dioxygenase-like cupin family protein
MTQHLNDDGRLFTRDEEKGFELPASPGVTVRPLLTKEGGHAIDTFFLTIEDGAEVTPETHPFSETLAVVQGRIACAIEGGEPIEVAPGQIWHNEPNRWHHVRNVGRGRAEMVMLIGVSLSA